MTRETIPKITTIRELRESTILLNARQANAEVDGYVKEINDNLKRITIDREITALDLIKTFRLMQTGDKDANTDLRFLKQFVRQEFREQFLTDLSASLGEFEPKRQTKSR
jgi:hypothetical protein